ncbi:DUF3440 domain-containing protein [Salmonella enterica]|nr:DUF3440 domain-containing protein [Salmonella enterica]
MIINRLFVFLLRHLWRLVRWAALSVYHGIAVLYRRRQARLQASDWRPRTVYIPSWRRICKVILRNDYWCRGLSFSPTRVHNYRNYMARLKRQREEWGLI